MFDLDGLIDVLIDNIKKVFFPEEWIELDLKFSKFEIFTMLFLDRKKETTMTELVEYINTPMSTATGIVDRLVRGGYVERERSESDRRIVLLRLTVEGTKFIENLKDIIIRYINIAISELTEEEKQLMARIVLKIVNNLQEKLKSGVQGGKEEEIKNIEIE